MARWWLAVRTADHCSARLTSRPIWRFRWQPSTDGAPGARDRAGSGSDVMFATDSTTSNDGSTNSANSGRRITDQGEVEVAHIEKRSRQRARRLGRRLRVARPVPSNRRSRVLTVVLHQGCRAALARGSRDVEVPRRVDRSKRSARPRAATTSTRGSRRRPTSRHRPSSTSRGGSTSTFARSSARCR